MIDNIPNHQYIEYGACNMVVIREKIDCAIFLTTIGWKQFKDGVSKSTKKTINFCFAVIYYIGHKLHNFDHLIDFLSLLNSETRLNRYPVYAIEYIVV